MTQKALNFLDLYFEAIDENIDEVIGELNEAGIDPDQSQNRIMQMIRQKKAALKMEKGKQLKARVENIIKKMIDIPPTDISDERIALAARKLEDLSKEDIITIKKDTALLNEIEKLISEAKDEA